MRALRSLLSLPALLAVLTLVGCTTTADDGNELEPCSEPAPLLGVADPNAPGYIVVFEEDVDSDDEAARLADEYPIEVTNVYEVALSGFHGLMSEETVQQLRCEPTIARIEHNATGTWGARAAPAPRR
jgi:hypothetical protein